VETKFGDDVDLNGRVTTRIVDRTRVDLGDRHYEQVSVER
jgi:hypothetical protein